MAKNYDEVYEAPVERVRYHGPSPRQERQMEKNGRIQELRQKQADRKALQAMLDKVEIISVEAEYLEIDNYRREDIMDAVGNLLRVLNK